MPCNALGQIMKHRIVRCADPTAEIRVQWATRPRMRKSLRMPEKTVGANHRWTVYGAL